MEKRHYIAEVGRNEYEFFCETWSTRHAWGHKTQLLKDGREIAKNKVRLYYHEWEAYPYQTVVLGAIAKVIAAAKAKYTDEFKRAHNYARLTASRREELAEYLDSVPEIEELNKLYQDFSRMY